MGAWDPGSPSAPTVQPALPAGRPGPSSGSLPSARRGSLLSPAPRRQLPSPPPRCPPASRPLELAGRSRPRDRGDAALRAEGPRRPRLLTQDCGSVRRAQARPTLGTRHQARQPREGEGTCAAWRGASGPQPPLQAAASGGCALVPRSQQHPLFSRQLPARSARLPEPIRAREQPGGGAGAVAPPPR